MFKSIIYCFLVLLIQFKVHGSDTLAVPCKLTALVNSDQVSQVGKATFKVLFWNIYDSQLLTTSGKYPVITDQEQVIFDIRYLADITRDELIERTVEQWQHLGISKNNYQVYVSELERLWPNISKGDRLSLLINQQHSHFYFNHDHVGVIESSEFGQLFIDIWLSESTSQPKLRKQLLGKTDNE